MSIADKLKTIAERMEDIYWAGVIKYAKTAIASGSNFVINDSSNERIISLKAYGRSWQEGTPTPSSPIAIEGATKVKVFGKNLFNINENDNIISANGASGVRDGNNITITSNTSYGSPYVILPQKISLKGGLPYTCSFETLYATNGRSVEFAFFRDGDYGAYLWSQSNYTPNEDIDVNIGVYLLGEGDGDIATITNIQCEQNSVATEYEPYKEQTLTLPYELRGLDEKRDAIRFNEKKYIQNVYRKRLSDFEWKQGAMNHDGNGWLFYTYEPSIFKVNRKVISTHFTPIYNVSQAWEIIKLGQIMIVDDYAIVCTTHSNVEEFNAWLNESMAIVEMQLAEPIETDLTDEQIAQYKLLYTNYPTTTIVADGEVEIEYVVRADK